MDRIFVKPGSRLAEGRGFEPPVRLPVLLISSQMPLTTQPPFHASVGHWYRIRCQSANLFPGKGWQEGRRSGVTPAFSILQFGTTTPAREPPIRVTSRSRLWRGSYVLLPTWTRVFTTRFPDAIEPNNFGNSSNAHSPSTKSFARMVPVSMNSNARRTVLGV